jgi:hypothetical protein
MYSDCVGDVVLKPRYAASGVDSMRALCCTKDHPPAGDSMLYLIASLDSRA